MNTKKIFFKIVLLSFIVLINSIAMAQKEFTTDKIPAKGGDIEITFIGHGSLMLKFNGKNIQVDPFSNLADYSSFPKADLILVTHQHFDHLDTSAIQKVKTEKTQLVLTKKCKETVGSLGNITILKNGESKEIFGIKITTVPAYNLVNKNKSGAAFHPKGEGNGYILSLGGKKIYIAGDTENTPEMKKLKNIDIAFLPMNLPYTMTPEMVADAVMAFKPKILYPYHFGETDTNKLLDLLKNEKEVEVRIREMK
jgi:L-ascorbate metabolism protein UlaG (beta-lactamase superfamily)